MAMASFCQSSSDGHIRGQVPEEQLKKMVTEVFRSVILDYINLDVQLLGQMSMKKRVLSESEIEEISNEKKNKSNKAAVGCLLTKLENQPQTGVYSKFLQCLKESENESNRLIAQYILEDGPFPNIKENFSNFFQKFEELFCELVASIQPSEILDGLNSHLSVDDRETILAEERHSGGPKSALVLLILLSRTASDWPVDFVKLCERSNLLVATSLREALAQDTAFQTSSENSINHSLESEQQMSQCQSMDTEVMQFSEEHMDTQDSGDMEICEQDEIKPASKPESNINDVCRKEEFGKLVLRVAKELDRRDIQRLATLFHFSNSEEEQIMSEDNSGLNFIKMLEVRGLVAADCMFALYDGLTDVGLVKVAKIVADYMEDFQEDSNQKASEKGQEYDFARLLLQLSDNIGKEGTERLMTLFGFKDGEEDRVLNSHVPSLCLLKELERKGMLGPTNVVTLSDKLLEAAFHKAKAYVDEYQSKYIVDKSLQKEVIEAAASCGEISSKQEETQIESCGEPSGGCISKYRSTLDRLGQTLTKDDGIRLATLLELPTSEVDHIERHQSPSHEVLRILEKTGKFSESNVTPLFDALKELKLLEAAEVVGRYINPESENSSNLKGAENTESKFTLRDEQRKLAEPGKQGKNYIILAETGFGKTLVATDIIKHHLKDNTGQRKKKVAFIVEKKSLADQQENKINEYLGKQTDIMVKKVTGYDAAVHLPTVLATSDVVVATAGVIHNEFKQIKDGSLTEFSLIIFDECHHCLKGHPFNQVMRMYHKEKREMASLGGSLEMLPQVIGMTATLGTGQAKSLAKAVEHALNVMANLDTDHIETVKKSEGSLPRKIASVDKDRNKVIQIFVEDREEDPFKNIVMFLMSKVEEKLTELPGANCLQGVQPFHSKDSQLYEQWVITNKETHIPELVSDEIECRNILACLEYLLVFHKTLCINREVRSKDAYNFLKKFSDERLSPSLTEHYTDLQWELIKEYQKQAKDVQKFGMREKCENPLLKELENLFETEYRENPKSLGFLFTTTIEGTKYLKNWIVEAPILKGLVKPECVTRETAKNQLEQIRKKFDDGIYNLLIVTSVADEGWSVDGLNLVFSLNSITSDYTAVQRPGRLRSLEGKYYEVAYGNLRKNAGALEIWKEMMEIAVKNIKGMDPDVKGRKLKTFQAHDERLCEEMERRQERKASSKNRKEYVLHCKKCQVEVCSSFSIRRFKRSQHYVASQEFCDTKMLYKPHHSPCVIEDVIDKIGKLYCKKCGNDWGIVNKYAGQLFPVIKITSFTCRDSAEPTERKKALKRWSEIPFQIDDVDSIEEDLFIDTTL